MIFFVKIVFLNKIFIYYKNFLQFFLNNKKEILQIIIDNNK
jgi:hypothetical protein